MARLSRLYAPGVPQLAQVRFARPLAAAHDPTPAAALELLREWLATEIRNHSVAVHAWVILPDSIVLLATSQHPLDLSRVIQGIGRRMSMRLTHGRAFAGRFRSALVDEAWVPTCMVWAESLPISGGLVDAASRWPWSSAQEHVGLGAPAGLLNDHRAYWALGDTPFSRQARYQADLQAGISRLEGERIVSALQGQWALGDTDFADRLASRSSRRATPAPRGRPRKVTTPTIVTN